MNPRPTVTFFNRLTDLSSSLKLRITAGFIASLVLAVGLISVVLVNRAERDTLQDDTQRELSAAARTAALLSRNVVDLQRALALVAGQLDAATVADDAALNRFLDGKPVLRSLFSNIFVATPSGQMLVLTDTKGARKPDFNIADRDYFKRSLAENRAIISAPVPGRSTGAPVIILTQPLRHAGVIHGVLAGTLRLSDRDLLANLVDVQDTDAQALTVVTDVQGVVLAHPDRTLVMKPLSNEPRLAAAFAAWQAAGSPVEPAGLRLVQAGEVVSAAGVAGPDWMVWRARSESELLAPLRKARREALAWAGGLIVLMSLVTFGLVARLLRPLSQLKQRAEHLFDGVVPAGQGWPEVGGEIGRLASVLKAVGTERLRLEAANVTLLQRLGMVMSASPIGIAFTRKQRFELVSVEFCRLFGRSEAELLHASAAIIYASPAVYAQVGSAVSQAFQAGQAYAGEWPMVHADGSPFWGGLRGRPVDNNDPSAGTIWTVNDISAQKLANEELTWTAGHDLLTGLANRRAFEQRGAAVVQNLPASLPAAVLFIDLDHFKPVNDRGGHAAGDAMLVAVAAAMSSAVRATDLVARLGGDEFAVLLARCTAAAALRTAENVRAAVAAVVLQWGGEQFSVGASLGVASLAEDTPSIDAWLALADAACYAAKADGRGVVRDSAVT